ncbi:thiol:disulfide interchange protein DsbG [Burkholderia gladioli]|uniref:thiol:disulfide interchange protein DsbG n=1 Tax=Burkholderia gladioli TaxID=28095 RepID=UPI00163F6359|nr:thiol:disulfide interchange protein DsbG [Burkholderia gladioli]
MNYYVIFKRITLLALIIQPILTARAEGANPSMRDLEKSSLPATLMAKLPAGAQVSRRFEVTPGLMGNIVTVGRFSNFVVYTLENNRDVWITGKVEDETGRDLAGKFIRRYAPHVDLTEFKKNLEDANAVAEGGKEIENGKVVYIFMDPNCVFCHLLWKALRHYEAAGAAIKWIPIGILRKNSENMAAQLLESVDGRAALSQLENNFSMASESGGLSGNYAVSDSARKKISSNLGVFRAIGFSGTPAIVYQDDKGMLTGVQGMPKLSDLPGIVKIREISSSDPELANFR